MVFILEKKNIINYIKNNVILFYINYTYINICIDICIDI